MKNRRMMIPAIFLALVWAGAAPAQETPPENDGYPRVKIGLDATMTWQALENDSDPDTLPDLEHGFQSALGNLDVAIDVVEGLSVYAEVYLSSKHHLGEVFDREGYVLLESIPEKYDVLNLNRVLRWIDVKAGHFEVDFGNTHLWRTDNADALRNPLVENYIVDPNTVEAGFEVIGHAGPFNAVVGLGSGVTTDDFQEGRGYSTHGKVFFQPAGTTFHTAPWSVSGSVYKVDHSGNPTGFPANGSNGELFSGNRAGSQYSDVIRLGDPDAGQVKPGRGQDELAWQVDGMLRRAPFWLYAQYGRVRDDDINGSDPGEPSEEWSYYGAEAKVDLIPDVVYVAGRWNTARPETFRGEEQDGAAVNRVQLGLGYFLHRTMLFKGEFVHQTYRDFTVGPWAEIDPGFSGVVIQGAFSF